RLARHLPEWDPEGEASRITLLDLLTHRSGLPAWKPVYVYAADRDGYLRYLKRLALERPPGARVAYSDPGYILLGFALERAGGASLDRLFAEMVTNPLHIPDLLYRPAPALRRRIAATEEGNRRERLLAGPEGDGYNGWRAELAWGEVHDLNARALGGISAHAGLFGTARAVHRVAQEVLGPGTGLLEESQRELLSTNLTAGLGEDRSLGFLLASSRDTDAEGRPVGGGPPVDRAAPAAAPAGAVRTGRGLQVSAAIDHRLSRPPHPGGADRAAHRAGGRAGAEAAGEPEGPPEVRLRERASRRGERQEPGRTAGVGQEPPGKAGDAHATRRAAAL